MNIQIDGQRGRLLDREIDRWIDKYIVRQINIQMGTEIEGL